MVAAGRPAPLASATQTLTDLPRVTKHSISLFPPFHGPPRCLTLLVLVGGEATHQAIVVKVWRPLLQLCLLVLYHFLPTGATGLKLCGCRGSWGLSFHPFLDARPLLALPIKCLQAQNQLQGGRKYSPVLASTLPKVFLGRPASQGYLRTISVIQPLLSPARPSSLRIMC